MFWWRWSWLLRIGMPWIVPNGLSFSEFGGFEANFIGPCTKTPGNCFPAQKLHAELVMMGRPSSGYTTCP